MIGYIYIIYCKDKKVKDFYIGSTYNVKKRMGYHRQATNTKTNTKHHLKIYKCIRDNGGFKNWEYKIIFEKDILLHDLLLLHERELILKYKPSLNICVPLSHKTKNTHKIDCKCGSSIFYTNYHRHLKTKKHKNFIKSKINRDVCKIVSSFSLLALNNVL